MVNVVYIGCYSNMAFLGVTTLDKASYPYWTHEEAREE